MARHGRVIEVLVLFGTLALALAPASAQRVIEPPPPPVKPIEVPYFDTRVNSSFGTSAQPNLNSSQGVSTSSTATAASSGASDGDNSSTEAHGIETVSTSDGSDPNDRAIDDYLDQAGANFIDTLPIFGKFRHVY
jgi:hypothetical protein